MGRSEGPRKFKTQIFTSSGTFIRPAGVELIHFLLVGGGGGGGGGEYNYIDGSNYTYAMGSGGGGGEVKPGTTPITGDLTITIGVGGTKGTGAVYASATDGTAGEDSTIAQGATLISTAAGGERGQAGNAHATTPSAGNGGDGGGAQQIVSFDDTNTFNGEVYFGRGADGGYATASVSSPREYDACSGIPGVGGGGGSGYVRDVSAGSSHTGTGGAAADCTGFGGRAGAYTSSQSGAGGGSYGDGGASSNSAGNAGERGGGGSGGGAGSNVGYDGGDGGDGYCIIWWY